jgi:hypothetical protein
MKKEEGGRTLFLIHGHSKETEQTCKIPEGIQVFHYCKSGCILLAYSIHKTENRQLNRHARFLSREHACLGQIKIYDKYKSECPYYMFQGDETNVHGVFMCSSDPFQQKMVKLYSIQEGISLLELLLRIQFYRASVGLFDSDFDVGILGCRGSQCELGEVNAIPNHGDRLLLNEYHEPTENDSELITSTPSILELQSEIEKQKIDFKSNHVPNQDPDQDPLQHIYDLMKLYPFESFKKVTDYYESKHLTKQDVRIDLGHIQDLLDEFKQQEEIYPQSEILESIQKALKSYVSNQKNTNRTSKSNRTNHTSISKTQRSRLRRRSPAPSRNSRVSN